MAARINERLSSVTFLMAVSAMLVFACLVFYVPHLEALWKESPVTLSNLQLMLIHASHAASNRRIAIVMVCLFAASVLWRVIAVNSARKPAV